MKNLTHCGSNEKLYTDFAVMLTYARSISKKDIEKISEGTGLSPIFFSFSAFTSLEAARFYSRIFNAPLIKAGKYTEYRNALKHSAFSLCDSVRPALFSVFSGTPAFINAENEKCRILLGKMANAGCPFGIMIPYLKNRTNEIKEVGARGSDFKNIVYNIMNKIKSN